LATGSKGQGDDDHTDAGTTMSLWEEIMSQPRILSGFIKTQWDEVQAAADWMSRKKWSYVAIAARGSSDNAARYAQYLWGAHNHLNIALAAPSLFTLTDSPPSLDGSLAVGISQSGESPDLLAVLETANAQGRPTLAITNSPDSPMAALADRHLDLSAGAERAVAATKSYTSQLLAVAVLSAAMADRGEPATPLMAVPEAVGRVLDRAEEIRPAVLALRDETRCVVIGRGYQHATAFEWALKIAELSYLVAQPFSAADFRHGPLAMVEPGLVVLAVATDGPLFDDVADLLTVVRQGGARVVAISDRDDCPADDLILLPAGLPEWLTPIPATVAAQVFSYHLTVARGIDPDNPRGLHKVTKTV
jgi:glucosamine--fructose-6-phosphate aminotransferase (isomerizing)